MLLLSATVSAPPPPIACPACYGTGRVEDDENDFRMMHCPMRGCVGGRVYEADCCCCGEAIGFPREVRGRDRCRESDGEWVQLQTLCDECHRAGETL